MAEHARLSRLESDLQGQSLAQIADAMNVLAGVAVARFGRLCEPGDDLELRVAELLRAATHRPSQ